MAEAAAVRQLDSGDRLAPDGNATTLRVVTDVQIVHADDLLLVGDSAAGLSIPASGRRVDAVKRIFDVGVAGVALLVSLPVWIAVFITTLVTQDGPVLFSQERIGRGGRMFRCWKFRTMRVDADVALREVLTADLELARQWQEDHKLDSDPRVTHLGRYLRRFDLDEIPQFLNVLRGDMSIVGPRPVVRDEAQRFGDALPTVLSVRPGLTGAWQVSGRNTMTYDERVRQEVRYVETRSTLGDLVICLKTPMALLRTNGGR